MLLERVTQLWGSATIVDSDPVSDVYRNTIYRPLRTHLFLDKDPDWGIYHANGSIVAAAAYCRFPSRVLVGQCEVISPEPCETAPPGRYVWAARSSCTTDISSRRPCPGYGKSFAKAFLPTPRLCVIRTVIRQIGSLANIFPQSWARSA